MLSSVHWSSNGIAAGDALHTAFAHVPVGQSEGAEADLDANDGLKGALIVLFGNIALKVLGLL